MAAAKKKKKKSKSFLDSVGSAFSEVVEAADKSGAFGNKRKKLSQNPKAKSRVMKKRSSKR